MVNEILDLAKIEPGRMAIDMKASNASDAIDAALIMIRPQATAKGLSLSVEHANGAETAYYGDRQRVQHSQRARSRHLQAAVVALTRTLRSLRTPPAPAVATAASNGQRPGGTQRSDRPGGGYLVGIPPRSANRALPGDTARSVPSHPWRMTFSPRQRRLNAAKRG